MNYKVIYDNKEYYFETEKSAFDFINSDKCNTLLKGVKVYEKTKDNDYFLILYI